MSTLRAILTRIRGIHSYVLSTGACSLVRKEVRELAPRRVMDALSKTLGMHHPIDRQVFNGNDIKRIRDTAAVLMSKVTPSPHAALVDSGHHRAPRRAFGRAFLGFTQTTLCLGECLFLLAEEARIGNRVTTGERGKCLESYVNAQMPTCCPVSGNGAGSTHAHEKLTY